MAGPAWADEFLNQNSIRRYPLFEESDGVDVTGSFTIPDDFLVGLYFPVEGTLAIDPSRIFLREIGVFGSGFTLVLAYDAGTPEFTTVARAIVPRAGHVEYAVRWLSGVGSFGDSVGSVVIGRLTGIDSQPAGRYLFDPDSGRLDPDCVRATPKGLVGLSVTAADGSLTTRYTGNILLQAGSNIKFTVGALSGMTTLRIDAITGEGLTDDCECTGGVDQVPAIRTISGVAPRPDGSIDLIGDSCLSVTALAAGIKLADLCSQPCVGCDDAAAFTAQLEHMRDQIRGMETFLDRLESVSEQFVQTVLGSKLGDSGCVACYPLTAGVVSSSAVTTTTLTVETTVALGGVYPYTYQFQRAPNVLGAPGTFANIGTATSATTHNDTGLTTGTVYWYRCVITDSVSGSTTSASYGVTTL